ncbi:MAG: DNA gyrase/topoisomerase IV subunit A [Muribaculaceae bacterium]|nr:DNA gyrase/topoisomerase IV subunit A [Muribaculaceae bacterium]
MNDDNINDAAPIEPGDGTPKSDKPADVVKHRLRDMFQTWFIDYASYTILDRAVPHIDDGLKPVQRRLLHSMKTLDDGRFNKVANIVGNTMQYHPHGDQSIYGALVTLGQKELLVETQGNWGNVLTGAGAAAPRYIEGRLSSFALDVLYSPKVTEWTLSYDGRKKEPVTLPAKFPILLAHGVEGIAVGLTSKILPHNFNEILDAAVAYLKGEDFVLYPDFQATGGFIDVSRYNDGRRGGQVKIRAKIEKIDNKTLAITEIPYGKTTGSVIDSILSAAEKGKIKINKVDDNTADSANIIIRLQPGTSSDKTIDALYAFTDCEISISPVCCVISDDKPQFIGVSDVLRHNVDSTKSILLKELHIQCDELLELLFFANLEKWFIENRIYKEKGYEQAASEEAAAEFIESKLEPFKKYLLREPTRDDVMRLMEIRMKRIIKYSTKRADEMIESYKERIARLEYNIDHIVEFTIEWFEGLKAKYGEAFPRRTVIRGFDAIEATKVAEANAKLYINREEGFIGIGASLKKDEFVCNCSDIDDILIIYKDGRYKVVKVQDKLFVGKGVLHIAVYKRNDERTIYNIIYQDGRGGAFYQKRCSITGVTRDREYNLTQGTQGSKISWFTVNHNGEAEVVRVILKPKPRLTKLQIDVDFSQLAIKGRSARGNLVTRNEVHRMSLKEKGHSTLGGRQVWFDPDIMRLNYDGRGTLLGEFSGDDRILVVLKSGEYYITSFELSNHFDDNILAIEKFKPEKVWTVILYDADQRYDYLKRCTFEETNRRQRFIGENAKSELISVSDKAGARFLVTFGGSDAEREPIEIVAADFVGVKSFKAKGKRISNFEIGKIEELEPVETGEPDVVAPDSTPEPTEPDDEQFADERSDEEIRDEINGQERLF